MQKNNRKVVIIGGIALIIIGIIIIGLVIMNQTSSRNLTCTREDSVNDFHMEETLKIELEDDVIKKMDLEKSILVGESYSKFSHYEETLLNQLENAYNYLDKDLYEITNKDHKITVKTTLESSGLILDNLTITANDPDNSLDVRFNTVNNPETSSTAYMIGDEYTKKDLTDKIEGLGYTCK